jgi:hypothetical protein
MVHYDDDIAGIPVTGDEHQKAVVDLMEEMMTMHALKEEQYKGSWAKRGIVGIFYTVVRPWDRIDNAIEKHLHGGHFISSDIHDALIDVAMYCIKWAAVISSKYPEIHQKWHDAVFDGIDLEEWGLIRRDSDGTP